MSSNFIIKKSFVIEINVDVNQINRKYPNYNINFNNPFQFIEFLKANIESSCGENSNSPEKDMNDWGYSIKISSISQ
ncbi:MAG: hypothetical protein WCJ03_09185 [Bacteroidales bacterium]